MKTINIFSALLLFFIFAPCRSYSQQQAPDSLGLPGDNLNLYAVMKIFQESKTLEEFERKLNDKENHINNLDLNNDKKVDYIKVVDHQQGSTHNIVMQIPVSEKEMQDVGVFTVEKNSKGEVTFQLVGDEDLYGKDYIIEPNYYEYPEGETPNPAYKRVSTEKQVDDKGNVTIINNYTKTEIADWPLMTYMYTPYYSVWVSPWYWGYYPVWWYPWEPWYWHQYYGWHYNYYYVYHRHYRHGHHYLCPTVHTHYYQNIRVVSPVYHNYKASRLYLNTYSRPETREKGNELFIRDVEAGKMVLPSGAVPERVPAKGMDAEEAPIREELPGKEKGIAVPPAGENAPAPDIRKVSPERPGNTDIREAPPKRTTERPVINRDRQIKEPRPQAPKQPSKKRTGPATEPENKTEDGDNRS